MGLLLNGMNARDDFNNAVAIFEATFPGKDVVNLFHLTQSEIRLELPLTANNTLYQFKLLDNQPGAGGQIFNTELRLRMQDTFVPTHFGLYLALPSGTTDATYRLNSYPNQFVFANALQMRALYNGQLKIMTNNYQYLYSWGLQRHWCSNQTQQTAAFGAGSPEDQNDFSVDAMFPMQPYVLFGGSENTQISITLSAPPTAVDANSRYILRFYGVLAQNSTPTS
jgi:hypothetical protein